MEWGFPLPLMEYNRGRSQFAVLVKGNVSKLEDFYLYPRHGGLLKGLGVAVVTLALASDIFWNSLSSVLFCYRIDSSYFWSCWALRRMIFLSSLHQNSRFLRIEILLVNKQSTWDTNGLILLQIFLPRQEFISQGQPEDCIMLQKKLLEFLLKFFLMF